MPRPLAYTPELGEEILRRMAEGESLRAICREEAFPGEATVRDWARLDRDGYAEKFAAARTLQGHAIAERAYEEAMTATDASMGRLRFDAGRWFAGKVLPKVYGEKASVEHSGTLTLQGLVEASMETPKA